MSASALSGCGSKKTSRQNQTKTGKRMKQRLPVCFVHCSLARLFLIINFRLSATQGTKNITFPLAVIAFIFAVQFASRIATGALHFSETLTLVTLFRHDVKLL
ncbi:MAG: hypothetical protein LBJ11_00520 [Oscillospiraceae bacterium]|nr:hypothetical protein [Oscillospiraceae bacterium]